MPVHLARQKGQVKHVMPEQLAGAHRSAKLKGVGMPREPFITVCIAMYMHMSHLLR